MESLNNDICNTDDYRTKAFKMPPNLKYLDVSSIADKVDSAHEYFEKKVPIKSVFSKDEMIDFICVIKGKVFKSKLSFNAKLNITMSSKIERTEDSCRSF